MTCLFGNGKGLTLVELMIAMVLSLMLMGAVFMAYNVNHKTNHVQSQIVRMQQDLRAVMDIIEREVRMAGYDPDVATSAGIISAQPALITVSMDMNRDGVLAGDQEIVSFSLDESGKILRNAQPLAENVESLNIGYFAEEGAAATVLTGSSADSDVRSIRVAITLRSSQEDPQVEDYYTRTNIREIRCRNMGL